MGVPAPQGDHTKFSAKMFGYDYGDQDYYAKVGVTNMVFVNEKEYHNYSADFDMTFCDSILFFVRPCDENIYCLYSSFLSGSRRAPKLSISATLMYIPILEPLIDKIMNGESIHINAFFMKVSFFIYVHFHIPLPNFKSSYISATLMYIPILEPLIDKIMNGESIHINEFFMKVFIFIYVHFHIPRPRFKSSYISQCVCECDTSEPVNGDIYQVNVYNSDKYAKYYGNS